MKRQRVQFESQLESVIDSHKKLLDTFKGTGITDVTYLVKKG